MTILALKVLLSPILIAAATLAGRRWGPAVSGWFIGFPLISGPISIILAAQNGYMFAANAAVGTMGGQASVCLFSAAYILAARKLNWWQSGLVSLSIFFASAAVWNQFTLSLLPTFAILASIILLLMWLFPVRAEKNNGVQAIWWDLPARMLTAAVFVAGLTTFSNTLGPQLSGLFSAFPVFGMILASFTNAQQGGKAAGQLMRGSILGSFGIASFYLVIGLVLPLTGSLWTYLLAAAVSLAVNGVAFQFTRPKAA